MATFVAQGHERVFPNDGLKLAVTEALNVLSKRNERNPNTLQAVQVFDSIMGAWRRIGTTPIQTRPSDGADAEHQKAMVACAKAVVEEELRKAQPAKRQESDQEEIARLRRENADLSNTHNQLRDQVETLKQERAPFRQVQGGRGRGMPQRASSRALSTPPPID